MHNGRGRGWASYLKNGGMDEKMERKTKLTRNVVEEEASVLYRGKFVVDPFVGSRWAI